MQCRPHLFEFTLIYKYMEQPQRQILAYLQKGGRLTVNTALSLFRTTELRKVVSRLKRKGHDIRTRWGHDTATPDGRPTPHKEYFVEIN